jgi:hypothetical protein
LVSRFRRRRVIQGWRVWVQGVGGGVECRASSVERGVKSGSAERAKPARVVSTQP